MGARAPSWVVPGAAFDLDFSNGRYWGGSVNMASSISPGGRVQSLVTGPGNSVVEYCPDRNNRLMLIDTYTPRITEGRGMWINPGAANTCLWSRDLTNAAWTASNMTVAKDQTGADGTTNGACSLTATAANATVLQSITSSLGTRVWSAYVRRLTGSGTVSITMDNGSTWYDVTANINASTFSRVELPSASTANPVVGFKVSTSGDAIVVDFCQMEKNSYPSTPIVTTTSSTTRGVNDEPAFNDPGGGFKSDAHRLVRNMFANVAPWSVLAAYSGSPNGSGWLLSSDGTCIMGGGCSGGAFGFQGASSGTNGTQGLGNINKVAGRCNGAGSICCINGGALGALATAASDKPGNLSSGITHIGIGNNGAGTSYGPLNGYIKRLTLLSRELTDGEMREWTRPESCYGN